MDELEDSGMKKRSASKRTRQSRTKDQSLSLKIESFGPQPEHLEALAAALDQHPALQRFLAKNRHRLLRIDLEDLPEEPKPARPKPPSRFRALFFDYTNNRAVRRWQSSAARS